jgi:hypothetical protein
MRTRLRIAMLLLTTFPAVSPAAERAWIDVSVRVYDVVPVAEDHKRRALEVAAALLAPAEIEIRFMSCDPASPEPACKRTLGGDELALRLVRGPRPPLRSTAALPLGDALLDTQRRKASLATIYIERVEWLARESRADPAVLLGRAIAHELVHALTGRGTHAPSGLMRGVWSAWEVARDRPQDWRLHDAEKAVLRNSRRPVDARIASR